MALFKTLAAAISRLGSNKTTQTATQTKHSGTTRKNTATAIFNHSHPTTYNQARSSVSHPDDSIQSAPTSEDTSNESGTASGTRPQQDSGVDTSSATDLKKKLHKFDFINRIKEHKKKKKEQRNKRHQDSKHDMFDIPGELDQGQFVWDEGSVIGTGASATVFRGVILTGDELVPCAVKDLRKACTATGHPLESGRRELNTHLKLDSHPRLARLLGHQESTSSIQLAFELAKGDLTSELQSIDNQQSPLRALRILAQVLEGLHHMHSASVVHMDLKPANVLVRHGPQDDVCLTDLGVAITLNSEGYYQTQGMPGTHGYSAPEVYKRERLTAKCDIFSAGVLAFRLLAGRSIISGVTMEQLVLGTLYLDAGRVFQSEQWQDIGHGVEALLASMLHQVPDCRPSAVEALDVVRRIISSLDDSASALSCYSQESEVLDDSFSASSVYSQSSYDSNDSNGFDDTVSAASIYSQSSWNSNVNDVWSVSSVYSQESYIDDPLSADGEDVSSVSERTLGTRDYPNGSCNGSDNDFWSVSSVYSQESYIEDPRIAGGEDVSFLSKRILWAYDSPNSSFNGNTNNRWSAPSTYSQDSYIEDSHIEDSCIEDSIMSDDEDDSYSAEIALWAEHYSPSLLNRLAAALQA